MQAKNCTLSVKACKAAQDQVYKGCNKLAERQAKVDARQQTQEAKPPKNAALKALGGLFKQIETPGKKPRTVGAFL